MGWVFFLWLMVPVVASGMIAAEMGFGSVACFFIFVTVFILRICWNAEGIWTGITILLLIVAWANWDSIMEDMDVHVENLNQSPEWFDGDLRVIASEKPDNDKDHYWIRSPKDPTGPDDNLHEWIRHKYNRPSFEPDDTWDYSTDSQDN